MNGCVYRTADNQCQKYSDPVRNTMSWCVSNEPCEGRTPSNADRIRAMDDVGLAAWYCHYRDCRGCEFGASDGCHILDWLKAPVEEVQDG